MKHRTECTACGARVESEDREGVLATYAYACGSVSVYFRPVGEPEEFFERRAACAKPKQADSFRLAAGASMGIPSISGG